MDKLITDDSDLDDRENIKSYWLSIEEDLVRIATGSKEISEKKAIMYRGDARGVFLSLGLSSLHIYPNMIVNGIYSDDSYDGVERVFKLCKPNVLDNYIRMFDKKRKTI